MVPNVKLKSHFTQIEFLKNIYKIPVAPMVVLANGSAHAWPSAWPKIDTRGIFPAHVSKGGG
jgi:hypothetical protein